MWKLTFGINSVCLKKNELILHELFCFFFLIESCCILIFHNLLSKNVFFVFNNYY